MRAVTILMGLSVVVAHPVKQASDNQSADVNVDLDDMSLGGEADPPSFPLMKGLALANRHPWDHRPRPLSTVNEIISEDASGAATSPKLEGCVQTSEMSGTLASEGVMGFLQITPSNTMGASEEEALESAKTLVTTGEQLSTTSDETTMQFSVKASKYNGDSDSLALVQVETSSFFHGQVNTSCLSFNPAGFLLLSKCGDQKTQTFAFTDEGELIPAVLLGPAHDSAAAPQYAPWSWQPLDTPLHLPEDPTTKSAGFKSNTSGEIPSSMRDISDRAFASAAPLTESIMWNSDEAIRIFFAMSSTMLGGGGTDTPTDENTDECVPANDKDEQPIDDAPSSILHHHGGGGGYTGTASNIESIVTSILGDIPAAAAPTSANDALSGSQVASASGIHSGVFAPSNSQVPCDSDMSHFLSASSGILSNSQVASNTGAPSSMQAPTPSRSGDAILDPNVTQEPQPSSSPSATGIDWRSVASSYRSIGEHEGSKWRDWASSKFGPWQDGPSSSLRLHVETSPALPQNANGGDEDTKE